MPRRTLTLQREVLQELTAADLEVVAGGTKVQQTLYSCMAFISCAIPFCLLRLSDAVCVETE
jgi:uncharacterized MAPEG superfamily protein